MTKELCSACAAVMAADCDLQKVPGGKDIKVTCAHCGRRRYGGTYIIRPKQFAQAREKRRAVQRKLERLRKVAVALTLIAIGFLMGLVMGIAL